MPSSDSLRRTLEDVAERIERYRGSSIGEQNTKVSLIMPVLRALGWDPEDLDEVRLEYRRKSADKPVDFALMLQREPVLFVEAKGLGENLDDRRWSNQIISYAAVAGVEWVVLTNGDEYRIYNAHAPVPVEDKLFRAVHISSDLSEAEEALKLLAKDEVRRKSLADLWRAQSIDNRVRRYVEGIFGPEPVPWLVRRIANEVDGLTQGDVRAALQRARIALDFPAAETARSPSPTQVAPLPPAPVEDEPGHQDAPTEASRRAPASYDVTVADLIAAGLLEPGVELTKTYLGQELHATVEPDGRIRFGNEIYNSVSVAAGAARVSVKGPPPDGRKYYQTNGWTFWEVEDENGQRRELQALRQELLRGRAD